ncbi:MAG: hypothetical protein R2764_11760 [Bacteroidales bacterium]
MRLNRIFLPIAIILFAFHYSCKTIESTTQTAEMTPEDKQEILQTKVDTSFQ